MLPGPGQPQASRLDHGLFGLAQPAGAEVVGVGVGVLLLMGGTLVLGAALVVAGVLLCTGLLLGAALDELGALELLVEEAVGDGL